MKKLTPLLWCLLTVFAGLQTASAKVWRVSNRTLNTDPDYTSLATAISAASAGDTIYVMGSPTTYGSITLDKKLVIIGPGYWLDVNDTTQAYQQPAQLTGITFNSDSEGSVIMGMKITGTSGTGLITISDNNITLKKNFIYNQYQGAGVAVYCPALRDSIYILQNWIQGGGTVVYLPNGGTHVKIYNNFIKNDNISNNTLVVYGNTNNSVIVSNNVIWGKIQTKYCDHINNILIDGPVYDTTINNFYNNICNGTQYPTGNNNQLNVDMSTVFVDYTSTVDSGFVLATGSPATGSGIGGSDCGVFDYQTTGTPYVLSGVPDIPAIFGADIQSVGVSSVPVTIDAISHNSGK